MCTGVAADVRAGERADGGAHAAGGREQNNGVRGEQRPRDVRHQPPLRGRLQADRAPAPPPPPRSPIRSLRYDCTLHSAFEFPL